MRPFLAQARAELTMTLKRGESLLLTIGIPLMVLVFVSTVELIDTGFARAVDFVAPATLALAVMSTSMTGTAIATGFEREYGVLKRLGTTPLGRSRLILAKVASVIGVQIIQIAVLSVAALLLGWSPRSSGWFAALGAMVLGTAAFTGLGLLMAGTLRATTTLALANGLFVLLLLVSGFIAPLDRLPGGLQQVVRLLPAAALASAVRDAFTGASTGGPNPWVILAVWACGSIVAAIRTFSWEPAR